MSGAAGKACDIQVDGRCWPGRPNMMYKELTVNDCLEA